MRIRCAWCKKTIGYKEPLEDESVTDGICDDCLARNFPSVYAKAAEAKPIKKKVKHDIIEKEAKNERETKS